MFEKRNLRHVAVYLCMCIWFQAEGYVQSAFQEARPRASPESKPIKTLAMNLADSKSKHLYSISYLDSHTLF